MNTVIGPPTNLAITPDGGLALVANSLAYQPAGNGWKPVPENKLFVIDLQSTVPELIATVEVGKQPSGLAINRKGDLLLIANRADNSISVLTINGKEVKLVDTVPMANTVSAVAITTDGKHALASKDTVNKVVRLDIATDDLRSLWLHTSRIADWDANHGPAWRRSNSSPPRLRLRKNHRVAQP